MALVITTTVAVNDTTTSYTFTVSGKQYTNSVLQIVLYVGGVVVGYANAIANSVTITDVTPNEIYTNLYGKSRTNGCYAKAEEFSDYEFWDLIASSANKYGNVTINDRLDSASTPTAPTTANPLDIGLADPINIAIAVDYPNVNPNNFFKAWTEVLVWNGSAWVLCGNGFSSTATAISYNIAPGSDMSNDIIAAMGGVSPRNLKIITYTACVFEQLWVVGSAMRTTTITNGVINSTLGGKIKVYGTGFLAKPIKRFDGTTWKTVIFKRFDGTSWIKTKN
jgi:hypothetical protein